MLSALGQKQTFAAQKGMSAKGQERTYLLGSTGRSGTLVLAFKNVGTDNLFAG